MAHIPHLPPLTSTQDLPDWLGKQQSLRERLIEGAHEFIERYTRADGSLVWRDNWPGMDGSDDPYEGFQYLPLLYALTGDENIYRLARQMWEAITWQWTEYGQIYREFDGYYDWMHHGEANLFLYFFGFTKPESLIDRQRAQRFAALYNGEDAEADNYDVEKGLIRAPQSGSRGPRHVVTKEDLSTHRGVLDGYLAPFEDMTTSPFELGTCNWSNDDVFDEVVRLMNERTTRGDVPLNMNASGQMIHAYMYSGENKYLDWIVEYLGRWHQRALDNGGVLPDNVGLSGEVGEYLDGKWWGGHYGWRWPHGYLTIIEPTVNICVNALMLTGDERHVALARLQMDENFALGEDRDGVWHTPHKHFDSGWNDFRPMNPFHAIHLWTRTFAEEDRERVERCRVDDSWATVSIAEKPFSVKHYNTNTLPWYEYINGRLPDYPDQVLDANHRLVDQQLNRLRSDDGDPRTWDQVTQIGGYPGSLSMQIDGYAIHAWQEFCPVYFESLVQLQWGAPMHISHGGLQFGTVRYFDADTERAGLPDGVGALVSDVTANETTLSLANSTPEDHNVVIQAGSFGENTFTWAKDALSTNDSEPTPVGSRWVEVTIPAMSSLTIQLGFDRYTNPPTYETPWSHRDHWDPLIIPRDTQSP